MTSTGSQRNSASTSNPFLVSSATYLAACVLGLAGAFQIMDGITAIAKDDIYLAGQEYTFSLDLTAWGWVHLIVGVLAIVTAIGIFRGNAWAMSAGIGVVIVSAMSNFAFLPYYPLWAVVVIALDVVVVWALSQRLSESF